MGGNVTLRVRGQFSLSHLCLQAESVVPLADHGMGGVPVNMAFYTGRFQWLGPRCSR